MKVVLINPPYAFKISRASRWPEYTKSGTLYYPIWLAYATGVLLENGHEAFLIDAIAKGWNLRKAVREVAKLDPEVVVVNTTTPTIKSDIKFVKKLKQKLPDVKIALVGAHVSVLPNETFKVCREADFIARREYDYTILELVQALEKGKDLKSIRGLSYKKGRKIIHNPDRPLIENVDELPFVAPIYKRFLDPRDYRYALAMHPMIQVMSSRGCPNFCTFCLYPQTMMGRTFRARSPENFVDELEWIKENMPEIREIFIEDDTFSIDKKRILEICKLIRERKLDITWSANARADIPFSVLHEMKKAGCRLLVIGYESGSQKILNNIKKGITLQMAERFTEAARNAGIKIFGCFMIGLPGETKETIEETFKFAKKLSPDMVFFQQAVPFPGTEFYEWCKKNGFLVTEDYGKWLDENGRLNFLVSYPGLSNEEMRELRDKLMLRYYASPSYLLQTLVRNLSWGEMKRVFNAAKDYLAYLISRR